MSGDIVDGATAVERGIVEIEVVEEVELEGEVGAVVGALAAAAVVGDEGRHEGGADDGARPEGELGRLHDEAAVALPHLDAPDRGAEVDAAAREAHHARVHEEQRQRVVVRVERLSKQLIN